MRKLRLQDHEDDDPDAMQGSDRLRASRLTLEVLGSDPEDADWITVTRLHEMPFTDVAAGRCGRLPNDRAQSGGATSALRNAQHRALGVADWCVVKWNRRLAPVWVRKRPYAEERSLDSVVRTQPK